MTKPCNCVDDTLLDFTEKCVTPQMEKRPHVSGSVDVRWLDSVIFLFNQDKPKYPLTLNIETKYRPLKKDGTPAARDKKLTNSFIMKYCPFCGVKWGD